ncbi:hypothetical protein K456DRAFT_34239 [Colletotrichum gloeosporioides 23]|nr:hypothetical protein K456DRAFT_34239 [Colletotrichum gloeosporioides 23]
MTGAALTLHACCWCRLLVLVLLVAGLSPTTDSSASDSSIAISISVDRENRKERPVKERKRRSTRRISAFPDRSHPAPLPTQPPQAATTTTTIASFLPALCCRCLCLCFRPVPSFRAVAPITTPPTPTPPTQDITSRHHRSDGSFLYLQTRTTSYSSSSEAQAIHDSCTAGGGVAHHRGASTARSPPARPHRRSQPPENRGRHLSDAEIAGGETTQAHRIRLVEELAPRQFAHAINLAGQSSLKSNHPPTRQLHVISETPAEPFPSPSGDGSLFFGFHPCLGIPTPDEEEERASSSIVILRRRCVVFCSFSGPPSRTTWQRRSQRDRSNLQRPFCWRSQLERNPPSRRATYHLRYAIGSQKDTQQTCPTVKGRSSHVETRRKIRDYLARARDPAPDAGLSNETRGGKSDDQVGAARPFFSLTADETPWPSPWARFDSPVPSVPFVCGNRGEARRGEATERPARQGTGIATTARAGPVQEVRPSRIRGLREVYSGKLQLQLTGKLRRQKLPAVWTLCDLITRTRLNYCIQPLRGYLGHLAHDRNKTTHKGNDSPSTSKQTRLFSLLRFPLCTGKRVHQPGPVSYPSFHPPRLRLHRGTSARYPAVSRFQKGPEPGSRRTGLAPTRLDLTLFVSLQSTSTAAGRFVRGRVTQSITDTAYHVVDN